MESLEQYTFASSDFLFYFQTLWKDRGPKALYQCFNRPLRRSFSRGLIQKYAPKGIGLEIGVGARTIAPVCRTVLSDAYSDHGVHDSIAKVFFKGAEIPYADESFSFILSEHVLEHISNPIKTIKEWLRVLKSGGKIFLFLPHRDRTNDKFRQLTTLEHLIDDYNKDVPYNDSTHFEDWWSNVVERGLMPDHYRHIPKDELINSASIHHHVWTEKEIIELCEHLGLKIAYADSKVHDRRDSFVVVAEKTR
jgi:SAM-dependent methyltransferase